MQSLQRRALAASSRRSFGVWGLSARLTGTTGKTAGTSQRLTVSLHGISGPGHSACQARHGAAEMSLPPLQRISLQGLVRQAREMLRGWAAGWWVVSRSASQGTSQGAPHVAGASACLASRAMEGNRDRVALILGHQPGSLKQRCNAIQFPSTPAVPRALAGLAAPLAAQPWPP